MSEDLIKRSDAAEVVYKALKTPPLKGVLTDTMSLAIAMVRDIPSTDRPQGEWIMHFDDIWPEESTQECSVCHEHQVINGNDDNYCPNCGCRMKGADDE